MVSKIAGIVNKNIHFSPDGTFLIYKADIDEETKAALNLHIASISIYKTSMYVPPVILENWNINTDDILESTHKWTNQKATKFSYEPNTGELLLSRPGAHHDESIANQGSSPFDDYVRGMILHSSHQVAFRPCMPTYLKEKYESGKIDGETVQIKSFELQWRAKQALEAAGATTWQYQFNTSNELLYEQTGDRSWIRA